LSVRLPVRPPTNRPINRIEQFQGQIDLPVIQQAIQHLRQELESQKISIAQTRRGLPRGWYRQSNPTVDLEILTNVLPASKPVQLPNIWVGKKYALQ
jgi:hypothetical protein